jgi:hypothetical protein
MRRLVITRLLFALLALVALSSDTATKLLHGVTHSREASERNAAAVANHDAVRDVGAAEDPPRSLEVPDIDADHGALHGMASVSLRPMLPLVLASTVRIAVVLNHTATANVPSFVPHWGPPSARAQPRQPRAPPLG